MRQTLLRSLLDVQPSHAACTRICWPAAGRDARLACHTAFHQGVDLLPRISRLLLFPQARSGLALGYACANPQAIRAAVDRLALEKVRATGLEASLLCRWMVANVADYSVAGAMLPSLLCLSPVVGRYCHPGAGRSSEAKRMYLTMGNCHWRYSAPSVLTARPPPLAAVMRAVTAVGLSPIGTCPQPGSVVR